MRPKGDGKEEVSYPRLRSVCELESSTSSGQPHVTWNQTRRSREILLQQMNFCCARCERRLGGVAMKKLALTMLLCLTSERIPL